MVDWGILATILVIVKGVFDIWKERHKSALDLSMLDSNIAQAASISVKSVLDVLSQTQQELESLKHNQKTMREDIQTMGNLLGQYRQAAQRSQSLISRLFDLGRLLIARLDDLKIPVEEERQQYVELYREFNQVIMPSTTSSPGGKPNE